MAYDFQSPQTPPSQKQQTNEYDTGNQQEGMGFDLQKMFSDELNYQANMGAASALQSRAAYHYFVATNRTDLLGGL